MVEKDSDGWEVFQRDVLDALKQYQGYFDFFERVGSLSDSRPDCFARITRKDKKEIWIVDAKAKKNVDTGDIERMEKYLEMVKSNPVDVGLELSELSEHEVRGIFVTQGDNAVESFEQIPFSCFHPFLQRELVYTDTDRVVRDVAKMMERKQLSQSQARLLFSSIKPFEDRLKQGLEVLERLENSFVGLELEKPPIESYDYSVPVDAVVRHREREQIFLFDIPYSQEAVDGVEEKVEEVRNRLQQADRNTYYTAINTFEPRENSYLVQPSKIEKEVRQAAGIVSPEEVLSMFTPKIPVETMYGDGYIEVKDRTGIGFRARVESDNDVQHSIEAVMPEDAVSRLNDHFLNTRKIGEIHGNRFREDIQITENLEVKYSHGQEPLSSFKDSVRNLYQSSVNPVLGKKTSSMVP